MSRSERRIVFVSGVHAAGKSSLCAQMVELGWTYESASSIIAKELGRLTWAANKTVSDVERNQDALVAGFARRYNGVKQMILDGHFTLQTPAGVTAVSHSVFAQLNLTGLILIEADPQTIRNRSAERGIEASLRETELAIARERSAARLAASRLGIPLVELYMPDFKAFERAVGQVVRAADTGKEGRVS